jgi:hypothetical protein
MHGHKLVTAAFHFTAFLCYQLRSRDAAISLGLYLVNDALLGNGHGICEMFMSSRDQRQAHKVVNCPRFERQWTFLLQSSIQLSPRFSQQ